MNNKAIDKQISRIDCILESCQDPELKKHYMEERQALGEKKIQNCDILRNKVLNQQASGLITEEAADELLENIENVKINATYDAYPWFEDASNAVGLHLVTTEIAALASNMMALIPDSAIGKALTLPVRKFILSRLSKYTMLHPETVSFKDLTHAKYDLSEAESRGIKFKHAAKWLDQGISRVHVIIYSYKKKPVMGIAYTKDKHLAFGMNSLIEPCVKDGHFAKDTDYYVACMCTDLQLTHPCIGRVLKQLLSEWKEKRDEMKADIQESVEESISNGTHQQRLQLILECAKDGRLNPGIAKEYVEQMKLSEVHFD